MTQEDKIKAAYAAAVQRDIYVTNYLSFKTGYLAALDDLKARGPVGYYFRDDPAIFAMPGAGYSHEMPTNALDITPLYRLEEA